MPDVLDYVPDEGRMWNDLDAAFALFETFGEVPGQPQRDQDRAVDLDDDYRDEVA